MQYGCSGHVNKGNGKLMKSILSQKSNLKFNRTYVLQDCKLGYNDRGDVDNVTFDTIRRVTSMAASIELHCGGKGCRQC